MNSLEFFFLVSLATQIAHSLEELSTEFHKRWYLFKLPFGVFLIFEIAFSLFWVLVWLTPSFPQREIFQIFFLVLMFANGIQHIVWWGNVKRYVPGLITAHLHVVIFIIFYFKNIL